MRRGSAPRVDTDGRAGRQGVLHGSGSEMERSDFLRAPTSVPMRRLRRRIKLIYAGCRRQSRMTVVRRERPPSKSASRPSAKTRRRVGSARALQSCLHRARRDAAQEAHALSPVTGRLRRHRLTAGRDVCAGLKATMEDVGTTRWKGPRRLRQMTRHLQPGCQSSMELAFPLWKWQFCQSLAVSLTVSM
jgi:hypothetical protein